MFRGGATEGYTIVESMIFLAVTGVLFVSAMLTVSGKQANVQFTQGVRDAQSKIQDIINQVATGYYPNNGSFTCSVPTPTDPSSAPTFTAVSKVQGSSDDCVFLGKVLQFTTGGAAEDGATNYNVFSVASRRKNNKTPPQEVSSLKEAVPTAVAPTAAHSGYPDITENFETQYGIKVTDIKVRGISGTFGAVAFFGSLPSVQGTNLASGAQRVVFGLVPLSSLSDSKQAAAEKINSITDENPPVDPSKQTITLNPDAGIVFCLSDQGGSRKAMITVGQGQSQTTAKLDIGGYDTTICP